MSGPGQPADDAPVGGEGSKLYVGNLPWDTPPEEVRGQLHGRCTQFGKVEYVKVCTWDTPGVKRKRRDLDKLHAGHAWVRFADHAAAAAALEGLAAALGVQSWPAAQAGSTVGVRVDWSRDEDPREPTAEELAAEAAREEKKQARRDHKKRFKARKRSALLQGIEAALGKLPPPGGLKALGSFLPTEPLVGAAGRACLDWSAMPAECDPGRSTRGRMLSGGEQRSAERAHRKRLQVESFAAVLGFLLRQELHPSGCTVVDFGCGSGALMLPLAHAFPEHRFVGVDMNPKAVEILQERAKLAGLDNVEGQIGMIEAYAGKCDCALALHACGNATDHAMLKAISSGAAYVVCPCCVGKLKFSLEGGSSFSSDRKDRFGDHQGVRSSRKPGKAQQEGTEKEAALSITHPRSKWMSGAVDKAAFAQIAKFADISHGADATGNQVSEEHPSEALARVCKANVECDRSEFAQESGYRVGQLRLLGSGSTAKTEMLVGVPAEKAALCADFFSLLTPRPASHAPQEGATRQE